MIFKVERLVSEGVKMKKLRIYVDTSVVGGCFDDEFKIESRKLFDEIRSNKFELIVSDLLIDELRAAPRRVREVIQKIPAEFVEEVYINAECRQLRDAYLENEVITKKHIVDAEHVAVAVVHNSDLILSWNFKHIVHLDKIRGFNSVNIEQGYSMIDIRSPKEVV